MTFLKIISFPIRLVLSLAFKIIAIVLTGINSTVIQAVQIIALFVTGAVSVFMMITAIGLIIAAVWGGIGWKLTLLCGVIIALTYLFFMFVPVAAEAIENFLFFAANKSEDIAEFFLTGRWHSQKMLEEIEVLNFDEIEQHDDIVQPEERKYSLSELQELSKIIGQMSQCTNGEAVITPESQTENQSAPLIEDSEISDNSNDNDEFFEISDIEIF